MTRITTWMLAAAVVAVAALDTTPAHADGKNEIRAVTFDHTGDTTRVIVRGAQTPTFTVYKLERPSRVVLDLPSARLAEALRGHESAATFTPGTWAVSTIAAQQLDDGGQVVRVIVSLARPGRYDVKTEGNAVVLMVTARDQAPAGDAGELAKVQAETVQARRAAEAQRAADEAKRRGQAGQQTTAAALTRVQQEAARARQAAQAAQLAADRARGAAETAKRDALAEAERARREAALAQQDVAKSRAELARTKQDAETARLAAMRDAETAKVNAARELKLARFAAQRETLAAKAAAAREAEAARADLARTKAEAEVARREMARTRAEAAAVRAAAAKDLDAAARAKQEAARAKRDAELARRDVATTRDAASRANQEAERAREEAAQAKQQAEQAARADARARAEVAAAKADAAKTIAAARGEIDAAKAEAARARAEAVTARADADAAQAAAKAEKRRAETAREEAQQLLRDAKAQLATLDKQTQQAQAMADKARAANAAAEAREEAARDVAARALRERDAAERAAKHATAAAAQSSSQERARMAADARTAEARLVAARRATDEAEAKRRAAETAAQAAKQQLDETRTTLATAVQQRTAAETAAAAAARQRGEAEAAATAASRRRDEAETAADRAAKQRHEAERAAKAAARERSEAEQQRILAETQRKFAERAAREAKLAAVAAERQRGVAEQSAQVAGNRQRAAEASLAELTTRRQAAERAASEVEARSKAEAKAQAEIAAATARRASLAELARVRAAASRLADERKRAESELAERRKAVAHQHAEATRLEAVAAGARHAASREEARRNELAAQRAREEQELARLEQQRTAIVQLAAYASKPPGAPVPVGSKPPAAAPVAARAPAKPVAIAKITDLRFKGADGTAQVDVAMSGAGTVTVGEQTATHVELIVDGAELGPKLERKLDVSRFGSPVRAVSSYRDRRAPNRVRIVVELARPATAAVERTAAGGITWRFVGAKPRVAARTQNVPSPIVGGFGAASTPVAQQTVSQLPAQGARNRRVYRGATVDLDFKDAPIHDLLRALADTGKVNIVVPEGINPKVTVRLKRVPWDQALEVILASHGLWYRRDGNLYRVADRKDLDKEDEAEAARREAMVKSEAPRVDTVALNYASATELKPKLEAMLSPKGRIEVDERTNQLIISDVAGNREQIARLALQLDTQTPQIQIEARIVEARSTFLRQFGIQWGGRALAGAAGGNATGLVFPSSIAVVGGNEDQNTVRNGVAAPSDFAINLPAATGSGEGGALGLSLGSVGGNFNINLRLSALEDTGTVRIISAPKITVLNNKLAKISQGVSIPISVVSAQGTQTQFVQADLSLEVTPYVSQRDCAIAMNINVQKNEPDFVNVGARGDPTILRKEARTTMLVKNGETSVLGGIYTRNSGLAYKKFPFLGDLPVLGWLFKNRRENDDRTEILVFITPKITNKAALRCE